MSSEAERSIADCADPNKGRAGPTAPAAELLKHCYNAASAHMTAAMKRDSTLYLVPWREVAVINWSKDTSKLNRRPPSGIRHNCSDG